MLNGTVPINRLKNTAIT